MGHRNIWIRKEDEVAWDALPNKSQFIHDALAGEAPHIVSRGQTIEQLKKDLPLVSLSSEDTPEPTYTPFD